MAPLAMVGECARAVVLLERMARIGSRMLVSDVACGAYLVRAAIEAASVNVYVNTTALADRSDAERIESACREPRRRVCAPCGASRRVCSESAFEGFPLMARLLKGAPVASSLVERAASCAARLRDRGIVPTIQMVRVGDRGDDLAYERAAEKRCRAAGIDVRRLCLEKDCDQAHLNGAIEAIGAQDDVHGILLFRPLPPQLSEEEASVCVPAGKDVDCLGPLGLLDTLAGRGDGFAPCTAEAVLALLDFYEVPLDGANVVVIGRSW